jgi:hypothetical protein
MDIENSVQPATERPGLHAPESCGATVIQVGIRQKFTSYL